MAVIGSRSHPISSLKLIGLKEQLQCIYIEDVLFHLAYVTGIVIQAVDTGAGSTAWVRKVDS